MSDPVFPWQGPTDLQDAVVRALRRVVDPELALSIVDLGLVCGVVIDEETDATTGAGRPRLRLSITMTSAACPVADVILDEVESALDRVLPEAWRIQVEQVREPAWTPERMSASARRFMG
ncbi:metal-sulfur cluster assembly factor [Leptothrix sp. BB-4]